MRINSIFWGCLIFCSTFGIVVVPGLDVHSQATDTPKPALQAPALGTVPISPDSARIVGKVLELVEKTKTINKNSESNERKVNRLQKMVNKLAVNGPQSSGDSIDYGEEVWELPRTGEDTVKPKGNFFRRLGIFFHGK